MKKFKVTFRIECKGVISERDIILDVMANNENDAIEKVESMFQPWVTVKIWYGND